MSVNLSALLDLLPERPSPSIRNMETGASTIRGPCPYDPLKGRGGFTPDFVKAVETVRADPRWGRVYRGDLSDYDGDHSSGDLALCGELARLGLNAAGIDTAFRTSGLYRDKWERDDYRDRTIAKALTSAVPKADDRDDRRVKLLDPQHGRITISTAPPAPRDYTLDGLLVPAQISGPCGLRWRFKNPACPPACSGPRPWQVLHGEGRQTRQRHCHAGRGGSA